MDKILGKTFRDARFSYILKVVTKCYTYMSMLD